MRSGDFCLTGTSQLDSGLPDVSTCRTVSRRIA